MYLLSHSSPQHLFTGEEPIRKVKYLTQAQSVSGRPRSPTKGLQQVTSEKQESSQCRGDRAIAAYGKQFILTV